jgi:hypothetical protein
MSLPRLVLPLSLSHSADESERVFLRSDQPASERLLVGNVPTWVQAAWRQRHKRPGESSKCQPRAFFERIIRGRLAHRARFGSS